MKVMVLGVRGIPNVQGGVETHAEQLYSRLVQLGCDVEVAVRTPFVPPQQKNFGRIRLRRIWAPQTAGLEAFAHSLLGVLVAGFVRPDLLHIHAIGPAIVTPVARMLGLRVVVTHHGADYERAKWGRVARWVLRAGERFGMTFSQERIAVSKVIADMVRSTYVREMTVIPNGTVPAELEPGTGHVTPFGLEPNRYILQVSRLVPEKRQLDLIEAFRIAKPAGWKLALVGALDGTPYSLAVKSAAAAVDGVVLTGFQSGLALRQIYSHAGLFVLPSAHEGLPIAMLEALSYGLPVLASDIPANLEVGLDAQWYVPLGNTAALARRLGELSQQPLGGRDERRRWVRQKYDWDEIAKQTLTVYKKALE